MKKLYKNILSIFAIFLMVPILSIAQKPLDRGIGMQNRSKADTFRIVGYFKGDLLKEVSRVNFSALTHINVAFINPDSSGKFAHVPGLQTFVKTARKNQVKVLASIGGGRAPKYYTKLLSEVNRKDFIQKIKSFADMYKLDGIDVDLEGAMITADYVPFIEELSVALKPSLLLTAAVATEYGKQVPEGALQKMDFINIMAYDKTGPWRPSNPGQHSPYEMAEADIAYWSENKNVPNSKLNLGLPFYGYSFNGEKTGSYTYNSIITDYPNAEYKDEQLLNDGTTVYYNGIATIRKKTALALDNVGGVMIWQLLQDSSNEKSLLLLIKNIVETASKNHK